MPTPLHAGAPGQRRPCLFGFGLLSFNKSCDRLLYGPCQFFSCPGIMSASWQSSGTFSLGFLHFVSTYFRNPRSRGGWGSGGTLGFLGAPLPATDPQRFRGRPMGPFTPWCKLLGSVIRACANAVSSQKFCQVE